MKNGRRDAKALLPSISRSLGFWVFDKNKKAKRGWLVHTGVLGKVAL